MGASGQRLDTPDQFISVAENAGLLQAVTEAILGAACREVRACFAELPFAINLSAEQFLDTSTPHLILGLLRSHRVPSDRLEIELTENALIADITLAREALTLQVLRHQDSPRQLRDGLL
jgi:EAL domain-containing protein (putative c-di-GMP-specific phosphodiesterase class I)